MGLIPIGLLSGSMVPTYWISEINLSSNIPVDSSNGSFYKVYRNEIKLDPSDGTIYLAYKVMTETNSGILALRQDGNLKWKKFFNYSGMSRPGGLAISTGNYIWHGQSTNYAGQDGVRKILKSDGSRVVDVYCQNATTFADIYPKSLGLDSSQNLYVDFNVDTGINQTSRYGSLKIDSTTYSTSQGYGDYSFAAPYTWHWRLGQGFDSSANHYAANEFLDSDRGISIEKRSSSGTLSWRKKIFYNAALALYAQDAVTVDDSGNTYILAYIDIDVSNGSPDGYALVKHNSSGERVWEKTMKLSIIDTLGYELPTVSVDSSGNVYVVNPLLVYGPAPTYESNIASIRVDKYASDGTLLWQRNISGTHTKNCVPFGVIADSANMFIILYDSLAATINMIKLPADGSLTGTYNTSPTKSFSYQVSSDVSATDTTRTTIDFTSDSLTQTSATYTRDITNWAQVSTDGNTAATKRIGIL